MAETQGKHLALGDSAARQLANATKTVAQLDTISPRWLVHLLQWVPVEAGIYRLNRVKDPADVQVACAKRDEAELPLTFVDYEEHPREYFLSAVSTVLDVHTRVSDLYSSPHDQIKEQLRLVIETIKEMQESELINNAEYGLLANVDESQRISTLAGAPTPDDLDDLITKVWKGARILPHPPGRDRCIRARMHAPRRAAADGEPLRLAVRHLARHSADPVEQGPGGGREDQDPAVAGRCPAPGRRWALPAGAARRTEPGAVGALHGHQPQRDRVVPHFALLLARGSHAGCARGTR